MPLDLHVLSLSLAFILSQDQTLHSKIKFWVLHILICIFRSVIFPSEFLLGTRTCCFILSPFQYFKELVCLIWCSRFYNESGCKDKSFYSPLPNLFASFFKLFSGTAVSIRLGLCQACFTNLRHLRPIESGCKFTDFFLSSKFSVKNFWSFLLTPCLPATDKNFCNPLSLCIRTSHLSTCTIRTIRLSLIAAAKINQLLSLFQIFLPLFFRNNEDL